MTKKITELPAATGVALTDVAPMVDLTAVATKKATFAQIISASVPGQNGQLVFNSNGGYSANSNLTFSSASRTLSVGAVTASLGLSGSTVSADQYVAAGGGPSLPTIGMIRFRTISPTNFETLLCARFNNSTDYPLLAFSTNALIEFGANGTGGGTHPTGYNFWSAAASTTQFIVNSVNRFSVSDTVVTVTVPLTASSGISGSLTQLSTGLSYLVAGSNVTITSQSNGQVVIASTGGGGTVPGAIAALTNSLAFDPTGAGTLSINHSGSTVTTFDAFMRNYDLRGRTLTTTSTPVTLLQFTSGANGRSYAADVVLMAQHTSSIECARWKMSGHYRQAAGTMVLVASDATLSSSNVPSLSGTLSSSAGNIIVSVTGNTGSFHWGAFLRVQELGV